jgi:2-oxoisovalerate dehydrogenase E1 component alpha subunit
LVRIVALDQRLWALNRQGRAALVVSCRGHEAAQIGATQALEAGRDLFFTYYRDLAVCLTLGVTPYEVLLGAFAKAADPFSGGRQFPIHGAYPARRIINPSNVVGGHLTEAVGAALAARMRNTGSVVICFFGEGAASQGEFHEAVNFAAIHRLPVIFFCENNRLATSVPVGRQMPLPSVAARASAYGLPGECVDGSDWLAPYAAVTRAVQRARAGEGPSLVEAMVDRIMPHTSQDDDRKYRDEAELAAARANDPLIKVRERLERAGLITPAEVESWQREARAEIDAAQAAAEQMPDPAPATLTRHVYWSAEPADV